MIMSNSRIKLFKAACGLLASLTCAACGQGLLESASTGRPAGAPTIEELTNTTFFGVFDRPVTLDDGRWEGEPFAEDGASRPSVGLIAHFQLTDDLDGDGKKEAAVLLRASSGGSGTRL